MPTLPQSSLVGVKTNTDQQMTKRLEWNGPDSDCLLFQVRNWEVACVTTRSKLSPLLFKCVFLIRFRQNSVSLVRLERHQVKHRSLNYNFKLLSFVKLACAAFHFAPIFCVLIKSCLS